MSLPPNHGAYNGGEDNHTTISSSAVKFGIDSAVSDPNDAQAKDNQEFQQRFLKFLQNQELDSDEMASGFDNEEEDEELDLFKLSTYKAECFFDDRDGNASYTTYMSSKSQKNETKPLYLKAIDYNDGVFRQTDLYYKDSNVNRLKHRLLLDDPGKIKFFDEEGEMKNDAPLIRQTLPYSEFKKDRKYVENSLLVDFTPGSMIPISATLVSRFIRVEVFSIEYAVHPLSSKATILTNQIIQLYKSIEHETELSRIQNYKSRIDLIRAQLKLITGEKRKNLLQDVVKLQELRDFEEHRVREIRDMLLNAWHSLKEIQENSFITAPFVLKWTSRKRNESERQFEVALLETDIAIRSNEIAELEEFNTGNKPNTDEIAEKLKAQRAKLGLRQPGETTWEPVLKMIQIPEDQKLTAEEHNRQTLISQTSMCLYAKISDKTAISNKFGMNPSLFADANFGIRFLCTRVPKAVPVEIWQDGPSGKILIATVNVPVVNGVPYQPQRIQFTSLQPISGCLVQGVMVAQGFIEPDFDGEQTVINEMSKKKIIMKDLKSNPSSFISVPKFVETTKNSDPNDPKLQEILNEANVDLDPQIITNQFVLDKNIISTQFSSMAPMMVHSELPNKVFRKQEENNKDKRETKLEDVIVEDETSDYSVKGLLKNIYNFLFVRRRPLQATPIGFKSTEFVRHGSIVLTRLQSAANVPGRADLSVKNYEPLENKPRVFARVLFEGESEVTDPVDMTENAWNDSVTFDLCELFGLKTDLKSIASKTIRVDLFDHVTLKRKEFDPEIPEKITENHFLATLEIPVRALLFNGGIDDILPMVSHPLQFGYEALTKPVLINLSLQSIPPLSFKIDRSLYKLTESDSYKYRFETIQELIKSPHLRLCAFSRYTEKKMQLINRQFSKINPPKNFSSISSLLRFVAAIPYTTAFPDDLNPIIRHPSIVLEEMSGSIEEHAVILAGFLESCGHQAKVVLGYDKIQGPSAFVLTEDKGSRVLLDVVSCRIYDVTDRKCTLFRVGTVFDKTNVWFNKQKNGDPSQLNFNTDNTEIWEPFFTRNFQNEKPLSDDVVYDYAPQATTIGSELQKKIEEDVSLAVELFRSPKTTKWANEISRNLRPLLKKCEEAALSSENTNFQEIINEINENYPRLRIVGAPFFVMADSSKESRTKMINEVKSEIKLREVFFTDDENVEFACASSVLPYPHGIFAVWMILVSITKL